MPCLYNDIIRGHHKKGPTVILRVFLKKPDGTAFIRQVLHEIDGFYRTRTEQGGHAGGLFPSRQLSYLFQRLAVQGLKFPITVCQWVPSVFAGSCHCQIRHAIHFKTEAQKKQELFLKGG